MRRLDSASSGRVARHSLVPVQLTRGPFTLDEARRAGLTRDHLRTASWHRVGPGRYTWAGLPQTPDLALAEASGRLPLAAAFSGLTAAWLHGLDVLACDPIEVTVPEGFGVSARSGMAVRRARLDEGDVVVRHRLRATSILRTLADLARSLPLKEAVVVVDMALYLHLVDLAELQALVECQAGCKGVARLRRVVDLAEPAAASAMETRLRLLLVLAGLPRPLAQVRLHDGRGRFLGRPDLYYPAQRLGLEYDGGTHRLSLVDDNRRQNRLLNAGFRLLRFTASDVLRNPESVVMQVRAALASPF